MNPPNKKIAIFALHVLICALLFHQVSLYGTLDMMKDSVRNALWTHGTNAVHYWNKTNEREFLVKNLRYYYYGHQGDHEKLLLDMEEIDTVKRRPLFLNTIKRKMKEWKNSCESGFRRHCLTYAQYNVMTEDEKIQHFTANDEDFLKDKKDLDKRYDESTRFTKILDKQIKSEMAASLEYWDLCLDSIGHIFLEIFNVFGLHGLLVLIEILFVFYYISGRRLILFGTWYCYFYAHFSYLYSVQSKLAAKAKKLNEDTVYPDGPNSLFFKSAGYWHGIFLIYMTIVYFTQRYGPRIEENKPKNSHNEVDINKFHQYASQGDIQKIKKVLRDHQHLIDINAKKNGSTALHLAISGGHVSTTKVLLSNFDTIDISMRNDKGHNHLDLAVIAKNMDIFKIIIDLAQPEISSLILALQTEQITMVRQLVEKMPSQKLFEVKVTLNRLCEIIEELKPNNVRKSRKQTLQGNKDVYKELIVNTLKARESKPIENNAAEQIEEEFECIVCYLLMEAPKQIFGCSRDHQICSNCLLNCTECLSKPSSEKCPNCISEKNIYRNPTCSHCREDFYETKPGRRYTTEDHLAKLLGQRSLSRSG